MTPLQTMNLTSALYFLNYQYDNACTLIDNKVFSANDFEWQKLMRAYNTTNRSVKIECGGMTTIQGNEYLGSNYRLLCNPVTSKYFTFISGALRESCSVMFKTNFSHDSAYDIFEEYSNLCGRASIRIQLDRETAMTMLLQKLNGAARAGI